MRWIWLLLAPCLFAGDPPMVVAGGVVKEVLWVRLDKGDKVLESLRQFIQENKIADGAVLSAVGSLEKCKFHGVGGTMTELTDPVELNHLGGIIADGQPHLHVAVSSKSLGALGGHLEDGCTVLSQVEITLARFSGPAMARRKNGETGPAALQKK